VFFYSLTLQIMKKTILFLVYIHVHIVLAHGQQSNLFTSYTTTQSRAHLYRTLVGSINRNLSGKLNDSTEDHWQQGFWALELLGYKQPWVEKKIAYAFDSIWGRSIEFQKSLLELVNTNYPELYIPEVAALLHETTDTRIFAACSAYLLQQSQESVISTINDLLDEKFAATSNTDPVFIMLKAELAMSRNRDAVTAKKRFLKEVFNSRFLPGNIIMYSLQRKNRNFPGIVIVRNAAGEFVRDTSGTIFNVPQLARSISNMPSYIRNGNTPQGIFRMTGFDVSTNSFIGPSPNIQLKMPFEITPQKFLKDSLLKDTVWQIGDYKRLIPKNIQDYLPFYNTYYAGQAGRTEIIAHGTTINPEYYKGTPWYPQTPSQGCLSTKEIWDGKLMQSDQQKLITALLKAGGANGYCVVVELEDKNEPVTLNDILLYLPLTTRN
jgi:hypothetical protein